MQVETITRGGRKFAVLPLAEFNKLSQHAEMLSDIRAYDAAKALLEAGEDEVIPFSIVERRLAGESPLKIWREYRGMTQENLSKNAGVSRAMIASIETAHKQGSISTLRKLATTLHVSMEQLASPN